MRKLHTRRALPALLALALCLTLLPVPAEAADRVIPVGESGTFYALPGGSEYTWYPDPESGYDVFDISPSGSTCVLTAKKPGTILLIVGYLYPDPYFPAPKYETEKWWVEAVGEPCTVTFDRLDGSAPSRVSAFAGGTVSAPRDATRPGFVLDGWYTDPACLMAWDFSDGVESAMTLYAGWTRNEYTVEFVNSIPTGEFSSEETLWRTVTAAHGDTVEEPASPPSGGLNLFTGWSDGSRIYDFSRPVTGDLTLRTERIPFFWEDYGGELSENPRMTWSLDASDCAFTLSGEGGTGSYECDPVWPGTFPDWYAHRLKIRTIEVREGADSIGKNTFSWCCGAVRASLPEGLESVGEYAFSGCGRLEEIALPDTLTAVGSHAFDGCARLRTIVIPESVKTIGERAFDFSSVQNGPVHIFYAGTREQWEDVEPDNELEGAVLHYECPEAGTLYPVTFDSRGGSPVEAQLRLPGELPEEPEAPEREGYTFAGWYRDDGCTEPWDFARDRTDGETALYAGWDPVPRTVRFSGGGNQTVSHGQRAEEPAAPVRAGARFNGWYTDEEARTLYLFRSPVTEDLTLYPGWLEERKDPSSGQVDPVDPEKSLEVRDWLENSVILTGPAEKLEALRQVWAAACEDGRPVLTAAGKWYPLDGGAEAVFPVRPEKGWRLFFLDAAGRPLGKRAVLE